MGPRSFIVGATTALVLLVSACQPPEPAVEATPNADLTDGQVVRAAGSGFSTSSDLAYGQCPARAAGITDIGTLLSICRDVHTFLPVDPDGTFSLELHGLRFLGSVDCAAADCILLVRDLDSGVQAFTSLRFRPGPRPVPQFAVVPDTDLAETQSVSLSGSGFTPGFDVTLAQCMDEGSGVFDQILLAEVCGGVSFDTVPGADGRFTVSYDVLRSRPTVFAPGTVTCGEAPSDCFVLAWQQTTGARVEAPISFGPPTPKATSDCRNGGWRDVADDLGQPFRTEGQCLRFVAFPPR